MLLSCVGVLIIQNLQRDEVERVLERLVFVEGLCSIYCLQSFYATLEGFEVFRIKKEKIRAILGFSSFELSSSYCC